MGVAADVRTAVPDELTEPGRLTVTSDDETELPREDWRCLLLLPPVDDEVLLLAPDTEGPTP